MRAWLLLLLTGLWAGPLQAQPVKLRLCTSDVPFHPYTMPDGSGLFQRRLALLARAAGVEVVPTVAPRARCLQSTRTGAADALIGVFAPERLAWMAYPMREGVADEERGLGRVRFLLYRRVGTHFGWDGRRFTGLGDQPLGLQFGYQYGVKVADLGVAVDDRATSAEQLMAKLARGRVALALMQPEQAQLVLSRMPDAGIEALDTPFTSQAFYVIVTQDFWRRHPEQVQRLWSANPPWAASSPSAAPGP
ncbi:MAG TPA: hypothetical protein VGE36_21690 [Roseateles sp.]